MRARLRRTAGLGLVLGASGFVVHIALRSLVTAGAQPTVFAQQPSWVWINTLGSLAAIAVLFGLPAVHGHLAGRSGRASFLGLLLIAVSWLFFGVFLSLYGLLILPWLAENAPALVAGTLPRGFVIAFATALFAWCVGTVLFGLPFLRGRLAPRWVGVVLPTSALWMLLGNLVLAPSGPAASVAINLLSNLGPVLLLVALARLGSKLIRSKTPAPAPR